MRNHDTLHWWRISLGSIHFQEMNAPASKAPSISLMRDTAELQRHHRSQTDNSRRVPRSSFCCSGGSPERMPKMWRCGFC
jgi:hypothetical protein